MRVPKLPWLIATLALVITAVAGADFVKAATAGKQGAHGRSSPRNHTTADIYQPPSPSRRGVVDVDAFVRKGIVLLEMLAKPVNSVPQSHWVQYADLEKYGWTLERKEFDYENTGRAFMTESTQQAFKAYSLSKVPQQNVQTVWRNGKAVNVDGQEYLPSGGTYTNVLTPKLIFATHNYAPRYEAQKQKPVVPENQITPLSHWSDVVFLQWQQFCGDDPEKMKQLLGVVRDDIENAATNEVIYEALQGRATQVFDRGTEFEMTDRNGQAILGTPLGLGVAYLLGQHRAQLGMLTVRRVKVYKPNDFMDKALLFEFGPVEGQVPVL